MSGKTFTLEILTPMAAVFKGTVSSVIAPGRIGYLGVLANHAPLVTTLAPGKVTYRDPAGAAHLFRSAQGGLMEVRDNAVTILADEITAEAG